MAHAARLAALAIKSFLLRIYLKPRANFFLRIEALDKQGVLANIASVLGNNDVSIAQVVQKSRKDGVAELVIITDVVAEKNFNDAMTVFNGLSVVKEIAGVIRVY